MTLRSTRLAAKQFSFDVLDVPVRDMAEIEAGIAGLAREPGGALLLPPDPFTVGHRKRIVELATRDQLPLVSAIRSFAERLSLSYAVYIPRSRSDWPRLRRPHPARREAADLPSAAHQIRVRHHLPRPAHSASMCRRHCSPAPTR